MPATSRANAAPERPSVRRLHVVVLTALAVATPLTELLRRNPEFLWSHALGNGGSGALVAALLLLPPLPLLALLEAGRISGRVSAAASALAVAIPVTLLGLQLAVRWGLAGWAAPAGAALAGAAAAWLYPRRPAARRFTTLLGLVALVAPVRLLVELPARGDGGGAPARLSIPAAAASSDAPPVVFVLFDELPMVSLLAQDGRWDDRNFPSFARLAALSHAFLDARSVSTGTLVAVPAMLSGSRPAPRQPPTAAGFPTNLFTLLAATHRIRAVEPATALCPPELNLLSWGTSRPRLAGLVSDLWILWRTLTVPRPWSEALPPVDVAWRDFAGRSAAGGAFATRYRELREDVWRAGTGRGAEFRRFVETIEPGPPASTLHFVHTMLPHGPWLYDPSGRVYATAEHGRAAGRGKVWSVDHPELAALGYQRHLLQARFADRLLGELIDRLEATGRFDASLIVVTSDHGASFRPGQPPREQTGANAAETLWVPLLVKEPGQVAGMVHRRRVTTVDVLPTVLDVLGVESSPLEGSSALGTPDESSAREAPLAAAAMAWKAELFGRELDFEAPLRLHRHSGLIGRDVASLPVAPATDLEQRRLEPGRSLVFEPASGFAPRLVSGTLRRRGRESCCDLALAVNGTIAAVQHTYPGARPRFLRFQALLAESSLEPGLNELAVYALDDSVAGPRLLRLEPR